MAYHRKTRQTWSRYGREPVSCKYSIDILQAFQELARGEQTASTLENHLDRLEARIEQLLAAADQNHDVADEVVKGHRQGLEHGSDGDANAAAEKTTHRQGDETTEK